MSSPGSQPDSQLTADDDSLMRDLPDEVVVAGETEALPEKLSTIWQSPFIRKLVTENGVSCWQCLHCNNSKRGHNASKVTKHVTGLGNQNVSICRGAISAEWRVLYRDLALTNMEKVAQQKSAAAEFNRVQERHDSRSLQAVAGSAEGEAGQELQVHLKFQVDVQHQS